MALPYAVFVVVGFRNSVDFEKTTVEVSKIFYWNESFLVYYNATHPKKIAHMGWVYRCARGRERSSQ